MLTAGGKLVTVLQLPSAIHAQVSPSPFSSVQPLGKVMHLVPPSDLQKVAEAQGYVQLESRTVASAGGKQFQVQVFNMTPNPAVNPDLERWASRIIEVTAK